MLFTLKCPPPKRAVCEYSAAATFASSCRRSGGSRPDGNRQKKPRRPHNTAGEEQKERFSTWILNSNQNYQGNLDLFGSKSTRCETEVCFAERHRQKAVTDGEHLMEGQGRWKNINR